MECVKVRIASRLILLYYKSAFLSQTWGICEKSPALAHGSVNKGKLEP